jgi:hypothetical protein
LHVPRRDCATGGPSIRNNGTKNFGHVGVNAGGAENISDRIAFWLMKNDGSLTRDNVVHCVSSYAAINGVENNLPYTHRTPPQLARSACSRD